MKSVGTFYDGLASHGHGWWWLQSIAVVGSAVVALPNLRLEASSDSLLLQGDPDLAYFRESSAKVRRGRVSDSDLGAQCAPLLSPDSLEPLTAMVDELRRLPGRIGSDHTTRRAVARKPTAVTH